MWYILAVDKFSDTNIRHILYDTNTDSLVRDATDKYTISILESGLTVANAALVSGKVKLKNWPNKVRHTVGLDSVGAQYVLVTKTMDNKFKLINSTRGVYNFEIHVVKVLANDNDVANAYIDETGGLRYVGVVEHIKDIAFEEEIAEQYKRYIAKAKMIGQDAGFEYEIEGHNVKIIEYTGSSKRIVLPNFITSIKEFAFFNKDIESIKLNNGLKYIGQGAFKMNEIERIEIPETVEYICNEAFEDNSRLVDSIGNYRERNFIISKNTRLFDNDGLL